MLTRVGKNFSESADGKLSNYLFRDKYASLPNLSNEAYFIYSDEF